MNMDRRQSAVSLALLFILVSSDFAKSIACTEDGVVINIHNGKIRGLCQQVKNKNVTVFYGVPYAQPPVGPLRWAAPKHMDPWGDVVLNATSAPNWCPQDPPDEDVPMNEDCLYLNIYVPGEVDPTERSPVLVWIHGKSFRAGSANEIRGELLAVETGLIVITINYRLGVLGYLSFDHELSRGNYGFQDQVLALKWIQTNANKIGADRNLVTIAGASAGGRSVSLHLVSPKSKGLFARAIIHSGFTQNIHLDPAQRNKEIAMELSHHTQCHNANVENMLNCMRNVTVSEAFRHLKMIERIRNRKNLFLPVADGEWLTSVPVVMADSGLRSTDLLIGVVQDEGSIVEDGLSSIFNRSMNATTFKHILRERIAEANPVGDLNISNQVIAQYFPANENPSSDDFKRSLVASSGDFGKGLTRWWADKMSESGGSVYMFLFNHQSSFSHRDSGISSVAHGDDLDYAIGSLTPNATADEKSLNVHMMAAWASFVKTGKPDFTPTLNITWPMYMKDDPKYILLSTNMNDGSVRSGMAERARLFYGDVIVDDKVIKALRTTTITTTTPMSHPADNGAGERFSLTMEEAENAILGLTIVLVCVFVILIIVIIAYCIDVRSRRRRGSKYETSTKF